MRRGRRRAEKSGGDRMGEEGQEAEDSRWKTVKKKMRGRGEAGEEYARREGGQGRRHQQRLLSGTVTTAVHLSECEECSSFSH